MLGLDFGLMSLAARQRKDQFSPSNLPGLVAWYDPSDLSTLFQDTAGTVPVTSNGDSVGLMRDKSGNGRHMVQSSLASRPLYETDGTYHRIRFDGINDGFVATGFAWGSDQATTSFAIKKLSDSAPGCLFETSSNANSNDGTIAVFAPNAQSDVGNLEFRAKGTGSPSYLGTLGYFANDSTVLTGVVNLTDGLASMYINSTEAVLNQPVPGPSSMGSYAMNLGRRANSALPFHGCLYGAILSNHQIAAHERLDMESWLWTRMEPAT